MKQITIPPANAPGILKSIIEFGEDARQEVKRVSGKMVSKALETVCAFANSEGGFLILGVADLKEHKGRERLFGVEENSEAAGEFRRKLNTEFRPAIDGLAVYRLDCELHGGPAAGKQGHLLIIYVPKSAQVHSVVNSGTFTRHEATNAQLSAAEITDLAYRRGVRSATSEPVPIGIGMLSTETWRQFAASRGPLSGTFPEQLLRVGLAQEVDGEVVPLRAAVLLFADEPGSLLASQDSRADIRLLVYDGKAVVPGATPNLRRKPETIRGPLMRQIESSVAAVLRELERGLVLTGSGFRSRHLYPERVVKEAIVNAVVHRDYRLNRDIFIRIFDDRIEVESPGVFPANITPANISRAGSRARNPLIALNLREFPVAPNIDAGEGVRMMFAEMASANLYPPQYRLNAEAAIESVTVTLFNLERPSAWDEVSDWIDRGGSIANADVCRIAKVDTLKASKMLVGWREQGLLTPLPGRAKRNMAYTKPVRSNDPTSLFSDLSENKSGGLENR